MTVRAALLGVLALVGGCHLRPPTGPQLAYDLTAKTVALVDISEPEAPHVYCSGEWVGSDEILTANHCLAEAGSDGAEVEIGGPVAFLVRGDTTIGKDGKPVVLPNAAYLALRDKDHDLALLRAPTFLFEHGIAEVSTGPVMPGQPCEAMGNPVGQTWSYSSGDISQIRWIGPDDVSGSDNALGMWYVQATSPVGPGSSGGGLYDTQGKLIGVTRMLIRRGENVNFFIHRDHVAAFLMHAHAGMMPAGRP